MFISHFVHFIHFKDRVGGVGSLLHICFHSDSTYVIAPKKILVVNQVKGFSMGFRMKGKEVVKGNRTD